MVRARRNKKAAAAKTEEPKPEDVETEEATEETTADETTAEEPTAEAPTEEATEDATTKEEATEDAEEEEPSEPQPEFITRKSDISQLINQSCRLACVPLPDWLVNDKDIFNRKRSRGGRPTEPNVKAPYKVKLQCAGKALEITFPAEKTKLLDCKNICRDLFLKKIFEEHEISEDSQAYAETELTDVDEYNVLLTEFRAKSAAKLKELTDKIETVEDADEKAYKLEVIKQEYPISDGEDVEWPAYSDLEFEITKKNPKFEGFELSAQNKFDLALKAFDLKFNTSNNFTYDAEGDKITVVVNMKKSDGSALFTITTEGTPEQLDYKQLLEDLNNGEKDSAFMKRSSRQARSGAGFQLRDIKDNVSERRKVVREQACDAVIERLIADGIMAADANLRRLASNKVTKAKKAKLAEEKKRKRDKLDKKNGDKKAAEAAAKKQPEKRRHNDSNRGGNNKKARSNTNGTPYRSNQNNFGRGVPQTNLYRNSPYLNAQPMAYGMQPVAAYPMPAAPQQQIAAQHQQAMMAMQQRHMQEMQRMNQMYQMQASMQQPQRPPQQRKW